jgi:uncharacterized protein DUF4242
VNRYIIERDLPGAGDLSTDQLRAAAQVSCKALSDLGPGIQWVRSHVTAGRIYCEYLAENEQLVREHAIRSGLPATKVSVVMGVIDPLTANTPAAGSTAAQASRLRASA